MKPGKITVLEDDVTGAPVYRVSEATGTRDYPHTEILHVPPFLATSLISFGKEGIGLASMLERHGAQFFGSGARPTGIISNDKPQGGEAGAQAVGNIRKSFREWQKGGSGDPLILDAGWKYDPPAMNSTDAQFLEHRLEQVREIARMCRASLGRIAREDNDAELARRKSRKTTHRRPASAKEASASLSYFPVRKRASGPLKSQSAPGPINQHLLALTY